MPVNNNAIKIIKPYRSICENLTAKCIGNKLTAIRPPSSGGNGNKFSTINTKLIMMPTLLISSKKKAATSGALAEYLSTKTQKIAMIKLEAGPAAATHNMSFLGLFKLAKLTGTGLAQPNKMPPNIKVKAGNKMVPIGSICLIGLRVIRPIFSAVKSPKYFAAYP